MLVNKTCNRTLEMTPIRILNWVWSSLKICYVSGVCFNTVCSPQAVQDFGSMCQERDAEEVKGVLPYWPRIYCKISVVSWSLKSYICVIYRISQINWIDEWNLNVCDFKCLRYVQMRRILSPLSLTGPRPSDQGGHAAGLWAAGAEGASQLSTLSEKLDGPLDSVPVWHLHTCSLCCVSGLPGCLLTHQAAWGSQLLQGWDP